MTLRETAAAVRAGRLSAVALLAEHRSRAEANAHLNAVVVPLWEQARRAAGRLDSLPPSEKAGLDLAGIPMTVKDIIGVAGVATSAGSGAWADRPAVRDASAVASLRAAGAVIVGTTNLPEFAFGTTCENARFGRTLSPLAPDRSPGGSSGGEAAAISAGISAAGLGGDYGGSVRWPAQCTGITSLRPTPGRIPGTGQVPGAGGSVGDDAPPLPSLVTQQGQLQVIGPMAPAVDDLRLLLGVLAVPDGVDPRVRAMTVPVAASIGDLRIGWSTGTSIGPVRAEVASLVAGVAAGLGAVVADVQQIPELFAGCLEAYNEIRALEPHTDHLLAIGDRLDAVPQEVRSRLVAAPGPDPEGLARAFGRGIEVRRLALQVFADVDVVLLPVAAGPACDLDGGVDVDGTRIEAWDLMAHCRAVTLLGAPVVSVPVGRSAEGLPLSVQVVAAPWNEHVALDVAEFLQGSMSG